MLILPDDVIFVRAWVKTEVYLRWSRVQDGGALNPVLSCLPSDPGAVARAADRQMADGVTTATFQRV